MLNFISSFERAAFTIGMTAANAQSRSQTRVRVIRQTSRRSIDKLIAALKTARAERDAAEARVALLERQVAHLSRSLAQRRGSAAR